MTFGSVQLVNDNCEIDSKRLRLVPRSHAVGSPKASFESSINDELERRRWHEFLASAEKRGTFKADKVKSLKAFWERATAILGHEPKLPVTEPTPAGGIGLTWTQAHLALSLEFMSSGDLEWFFRDRSTDELDGMDDASPDLPDEFFARLKQLHR